MRIYSNPEPSADDPDVPGPQTLENEIDDGDMFPGWYIGWREKFSDVSDDWQIERSRDPAAAPLVRPQPTPDALARKCSFCGSTDYAQNEVWRSPLAECVICTNCATLATRLLRKDDGGDDSNDDPDQAET